MSDFFRKLFCKHDYEQEYLHMIDGGMDKLYKLTCKKCGKEIFVRGGGFINIWEVKNNAVIF